MEPKERFSKKTPDIGLHACPDAQRGITLSALRSEISIKDYSYIKGGN